MKGYLSRIASQSGHRFSGQDAVRPNSAMEPHAETPPLLVERDEMVMLPPPEKNDAQALEPGATDQRPAREPAKPMPDRKKKRSGSDQEQQYFARTAEIIHGGDAEASEVQTTLLQEIQEWVAAGEIAETEAGTEADLPLVASTSTKIVENQDLGGTAEAVLDRSFGPRSLSGETFETRELVRTAEPEPGVVRVGAKRPTSIPHETPRIDEQSFDLSIGSISVVVEGDERRPQPAPVRERKSESNDSNQEKSRFSRLSRNYL